MKITQILINLFTISVIAIVPHLDLIPNFGYSIPILLLVWIALKNSGESFKDIGFSFKSFRWKWVPIGFFSAVVILAFMQLVFFPLLELVVSFEAADVGLYDFIKQDVVSMIFIVLMGWIIGGFYEEIVFHGFIFSRLEQMIPGKYATQISFISTATIFGLYHLQLGMAGAINAFFVGIAYLFLVTHFKRNLWPAIITHGCYNTLVVILIYLDYL